MGGAVGAVVVIASSSSSKDGAGWKGTKSKRVWEKESWWGGWGGLWRDTCDQGGGTIRTEMQSTFYTMLRLKKTFIVAKIFLAAEHF